MMRILENMQPFALLVLRAVLGLVMAARGWLKVAGGMAEFKGFLVSIGIPGWMGYASAYAEFLGGILLIVGLLTRFAALTIFINMMVAVLTVHWKNGLLGAQGYQFPLALVAMAFALIFFGGGPISLDTAIFHGPKKGPSK
ncbi:MAG: DoxX family protein [Terriglobales bacterium]